MDNDQADSVGETAIRAFVDRAGRPAGRNL